MDLGGKPSEKRLACPVDTHDAIVSADCANATKCHAIVAAEGKLWRCSQDAAISRRLGVSTKPVASLSDEYLQAHQPLTVWAAGDPSVTTLFAAPRNGSVVKMRRSGSVLRPLAELALPASMPTTFTWEMLAVIDA